MKRLILIVISVLAYVLVNAQERDINERYLPVEESSVTKRQNTPRPYAPRNAFRAGGGGGDIITTDCYSFVPIPEDAIELDENSADSGNSLDGAWGPFPLDFTFCHFGDSYNQFYINMKGNITFDNFNTTFVPAGFPSNDFAMIAGYWADIDLRCADCGTVYYWTTPTAAYITFLDVGYYNNHGDLNNTFQIVITDQTDEVVGEGNNVGLFYQDMQWAAGDWNGGLNGFGGTAAGTVGANKNDGLNYIQFGRFLDNSEDYDGAFGTDDGVHWLDDKAFVFNLCSNEDNLPPIAGNSDACDTLYICQNDSYDFDLSFLGPEPNQTVTITVDDSEADGWSETSSGPGFITGVFEGDAGNVGDHTLVFTATDDGDPVGITVITYNIVVQDIVVPDLTVSGTGFENDVVAYCGSLGGVDLTASDGFDVYVWSNNTNGQTTTLTGGDYTVTGILSGCEVEYGPFNVFQIPQFNPDVTLEDLFLCEGETTNIILQDEEDYSSIEWEIYNMDGNILSSDLQNDSIEVTAGFYQVTVVDETGCEGSRIVPVAEQVVNLPSSNFGDLCDETSLSWTGGWTQPEECAHFIYLYDSGADTWEGANLEVYIDGTGPFNFNIANGAGFLPTGVTSYNGQTIEYVFTPGLDDAEIDISIFECGNTTPIFDSTQPGDDITNGTFFVQNANTDVNPIPGSWTSSCPDGVFSNPDVYNPIPGNQTFSVPDGFVGCCTLTFTSDESICDIETSFEVCFSSEPTLSVMTPDPGCSEDGVELVADFSPAGCFVDWTPNGGCDGQSSCVVFSSGTYLVSASNDCGEASTTVDVVLTPTPAANLAGYTLCDGATQVLNPGPTDDSFTYAWTTPTGSPTTATTVASAAGDYAVTISNNCGTATATSSIITDSTPIVNPWAVDTLVCPGETVTFDPVWNNGNGLSSPVSWSMSWDDLVGNPQFQAFSETGQELDFGSDQIPQDALTSGVVVSYSTANGCGAASGSIVAYTDACFIEAYNIITPDSDGGDGSDVQNLGLSNKGLNEGWQIIGIDGLGQVEVRIFDRWGQLVYENDNYRNTDPWNGEHTNGSDLDDGVYFYTINTPRTDSAFQGTVTVLRKK